MSSSPQQQQSGSTTNNNDNDNNNQNNASGKSKGKQKKKGEKLDFELHMVNANWATIMEDDADSAVPIPPIQYNLPDAPKSVSSEIDTSQIPSHPPFYVTLRNLSTEIERSDIEDKFKHLNIVNIDLIKEGRVIRGAVIEFSTKQDLLNGLKLNNKILRGRYVNMILGNMPNDRGYDRGDRRMGGRGRDNTPNDWRSSTDTMPPKSIAPPPTIDQYDNRGGFGGGGPGGSGRGPRGRYDDDYQPRNDYGGRGSGGYDDRGGRHYDDQGYNRRRNNDYGGGGHYRDNHDRMAPPPEQEMDNNWRRGPPPPPPAADLYEPHHQARGPPPPPAMSRGSPPRYNRAMPPPAPDNIYNDSLYGVAENNYRPPMNDRRHDQGQYGGGPRRSDYRDDRIMPEQRSGHRNPPLMDHPPPQRERLPSTRSNISDTQASDDLDKPAGPSNVAPAAPKERRPFINPAILGQLQGLITDTKPQGNSSIFGEAKPVDTREKEREIELKLQNSKLTDPPPRRATPPPPRNDGDGGPPPQQHSRGDYQDSTMPPRHARNRTNGGMGSTGVAVGIRGPQRRDNYDDRNGALGDRRGPMGPSGMGGGQRGGPPPPRDGGGMRMRNDRRGPMPRDNDNGREYYGTGTGNDRRRFNDRIGGRRGYGNDDMGGGGGIGNVAPRYDRGPRGGGGGGYDNERNRYHSSGSDYIDFKADQDDSKSINYTSKNKFFSLGETEDHEINN